MLAIFLCFCGYALFPCNEFSFDPLEPMWCNNVSKLNALLGVTVKGVILTSSKSFSEFETIFSTKSHLFFQYWAEKKIKWYDCI